MAAPTPIKRSAELTPLSREHHEGLLFVWKLRQAVSKGIEATRIVAFVDWFWQHHLQPHFAKEERALTIVFPTTHLGLERLLREHEIIQKAIADFCHYGDLKKLSLLAQLIHDHIRFEERQLFGEAERQATPEQLKQIKMIVKDDAAKQDWHDAFWVS